jgi:hypothetical protein
MTRYYLLLKTLFCVGVWTFQGLCGCSEERTFYTCVERLLQAKQMGRFQDKL